MWGGGGGGWRREKKWTSRGGGVGNQYNDSLDLVLKMGRGEGEIWNQYACFCRPGAECMKIQTAEWAEKKFFQFNSHDDGPGL